MPKLNERPCDGCTLCCETLSIEVLDKPACQKCKHQIDGTGCAIYADRPEPCRTFKCLWHAGENVVLTDAHKPDKIGAVFTYQPTASGRSRVVCHVLNMGDAYKGRAFSAVKKFAKRGQIVALVCEAGGKYEAKIIKKGDV